MENNAKQTAITVAIITGIFGCLAAIVTLGQPFAERVAEAYFATDTPAPTPRPLLPENGEPIAQNILFVTDYNDIFAMNENGTDIRTLTSGAFIDDFPQWSPDGKYVAFHSSRSGNSEIYIMSATSKELINITNNPADDYFPSWSPDGRKIIYTSFQDDDVFSDLYILDLITNQVTQITETTKYSEMVPDWSPDGYKVVFIEIDDINYTRLATIDVNGNNKKIIIDTGSYLTTPAWSPDAKFISYTSFEHKIENNEFMKFNPLIFITNENATVNSQIASGIDPDWSSDGQKIVFWRNTEFGYGDLFVFNKSDASLINLTNTPYQTETGPNWVWK